MKNTILITVPNLLRHGGVSEFWNSLFQAFKKFDNMNFSIYQIGGHGKNIFGPLIDQWNFKKHLASKPDLVFLNPSLGLRSFFRDALFAKKTIKKDIPFVVFFHGWDLDFEKKVDQKYRKFFLNSFGRAKKMFVLSSDFKEKIIEWGYAGEIVVETTNVDSALLSGFNIEERLAKQRKDKTKILFLARLIREKGVFETVEAFVNISKRMSNIELIIAGDGEDLDELKKLVHGTNIRVTGHVGGQNKINLFKESDIYCLPTYGEGLPTSVLEAMAFGLPVITTNVGGLKEFFQDKKMGYFVKGDNIKNIEEKLIQLISDRDKSKEMSKYNYEYAQKRLLNIVVAERLHKHIKDVLS